MRSPELVLTYEHGRWHARGAGIEVAHAELRELEALIEIRVATDAAPVEVRLAFDAGTLPRWLQQYHGHYCNYTLHVARRSAPA